MPLVGLWCMTVAFPGHAHLLFCVIMFSVLPSFSVGIICMICCGLVNLLVVLQLRYLPCNGISHCNEFDQSMAVGWYFTFLFKFQ